MTPLYRQFRARIATVVLLPLLAVAACSDDKTEDPGAVASGGSGGNGGTAAGGIQAKGGATPTGGISSSTGGAATGGATTVPTGGTSSATGGAATNPSSGGAATGGTISASGGVANGGTNAGGGGTASGGSAAGGSSAGNTGSGGASVFHIFMLMGQSNMAGVAKKQASDENTDDRLKVLGGCNQPAGQWNTAKPPLNDCPGEKGWNLNDTVDPGIWFAKTLLEKLPKGDTIGLIGTAESGESINTFITGGSHHQMILNKIAKAKMTAPDGRFAGIIFHQGESDNGQNTWPDKVVQLYNEVKKAWGVSYDVPFVLGELPAGGCCAGHNTQVHAAADKLPIGAWVSQEGTKVMDEYHFDHASVVLMGQRYGEKMIEKLKW